MSDNDLHLGPEVALHQDELLLGPDAIHRPKKKWPWFLLALFLAVSMVAALLLSGSWLGKRPASPEDLTVELGEMPKVEPVTLKPIAPQLALEINASVPVTTALVPAAKPFRVGQSGSDAERAADCLAATIYYEAAMESLEGQMAVAQVVLNRVRHPAFPKTVCGVVFQGSERRTGCQFSFTCDGSMARRQPSGGMWQRMRGVAISMLSGGVYAPVGNATHYHANYVVPYWASSLDKVRTEGMHIFYRWKGGWGGPRAFVGRYTGNETGLIKPRPLDPMVSPGLPLPTDQPMIPIDDRVVEKAVAGGATTAMDRDRGQFIIRADPGMNPAQLPQLAQQACAGRDYCKVLAWSDPRKMPKGFPVAPDQLESMAFSYLRIREQGFEKSLWNCIIFPRSDRTQCIRQRVVEEQPTGRRRPGANYEGAEAPVSKGTAPKGTAPSSAGGGLVRQRPGGDAPPPASPEGGAQ